MYIKDKKCLNLCSLCIPEPSNCNEICYRNRLDHEEEEYIGISSIL